MDCFFSMECSPEVVVCSGVGMAVVASLCLHEAVPWHGGGLKLPCESSRAHGLNHVIWQGHVSDQEVRNGAPKVVDWVVRSTTHCQKVELNGDGMRQGALILFYCNNTVTNNTAVTQHAKDILPRKLVWKSWRYPTPCCFMHKCIKIM